jgi:hypoxanthine phosphoribosyltransferase
MKDISWNEIDQACRTVNLAIPDIIIGIARGGLIPATILSHRFESDLAILQISSYEGQEQKGFIFTTPAFDIEELQDKRVLIVDDICDSGNTLLFAKDILDIDAETFVLIDKGRTDRPTYVGIETEPSLEWIKFPWE